MNKCIQLAQIAKERGDSPVGSVLVKGKTIIGEGIEGGKTFKDITFHSEIEAIRDAIKSHNIKDLSDCVLFSTHEPCIMCSYVIRHHKIKTIVYAIAVDNIGGHTSSFKILEDQTVKKWGDPPAIITGILKEECQALHQ